MLASLNWLFVQSRAHSILQSLEPSISLLKLWSSLNGFIIEALKLPLIVCIPAAGDTRGYWRHPGHQSLSWLGTHPVSSVQSPDSCSCRELSTCPHTPTYQNTHSAHSSPHFTPSSSSSFRRISHSSQFGAKILWQKSNGNILHSKKEGKLKLWLNGVFYTNGELKNIKFCKKIST